MHLVRSSALIPTGGMCGQYRDMTFQNKTDERITSLLGSVLNEIVVCSFEMLMPQVQRKAHIPVPATIFYVA